MQRWLSDSSNNSALIHFDVPLTARVSVRLLKTVGLCSVYLCPLPWSTGKKKYTVWSWTSSSWRWVEVTFKIKVQLILLVQCRSKLNVNSNDKFKLLSQFILLDFHSLKNSTLIIIIVLVQQSNPVWNWSSSPETRSGWDSLAGCYCPSVHCEARSSSNVMMLLRYIRGHQVTLRDLLSRPLQAGDSATLWAASETQFISTLLNCF